MTTFTVMTYNVGNGLARPERLARLLRESDADLIGLQELTPDQAATLGPELRCDYPYQSLHGAGIPGKGLLSRYPVLDATLLDLHPGRPDLRARLKVNGERLQFLVAHPPPPRLHRRGVKPTPYAQAQLGALLKLAQSGEPTVLLGDFNMRDTHTPYDDLVQAGLIDAFRAVGRQGHTFPLRRGSLPLRPLLRLDYIWHTPHLRALDARIGPDGGSDHLPVLAKLSW